MAEVFSSSDPQTSIAGFRAAKTAIARGELVVLPTDTVYGVGADAFNPDAVGRLLDAKMRTRQSPPPVLIPDLATLTALAAAVPEPVLQLATALWPGPLTLVLQAQPMLDWDLGDTGGTVALRMPDHSFTLQLLAETGPLAVSSANIHGEPAALTAAAAQQQLGARVSVYLDDGAVSGDGTPSTILDVTECDSPTGRLRVLREGAISRATILQVLPEITIVD